MTNEEIVRRIREERKKQGVSLRDLGKMLGMSGQYLSMIERGASPLKMEDFFKICQALERNPIIMIREKEDITVCETLAEKICALSNRDFQILTNIIDLMQ